MIDLRERTHTAFPRDMGPILAHTFFRLNLGRW
jgi:hypothetical protein